MRTVTISQEDAFDLLALVEQALQGDIDIPESLELTRLALSLQQAIAEN